MLPERYQRGKTTTTLQRGRDTLNLWRHIYDFVSQLKQIHGSHCWFKNSRVTKNFEVKTNWKRWEQTKICMLACWWTRSQRLVQKCSTTNNALHSFDVRGRLQGQNNKTNKRLGTIIAWNERNSWNESCFEPSCISLDFQALLTENGCQEESRTWEWLFSYCCADSKPQK